MAFTGADYHRAFEEACAKLPFERAPEIVRSELEGIEWILWETIRGTFFYVAIIVAGLIVVMPAYLLNARASLEGSVIALAAITGLALAVYWLCRLIFHFEVATHVKGRKFGSGGID
ncbi:MULTISPECIES: hypothetical protein [unclassified Mesorhizobium]|uniref:hypothetical protein n=1 Tax=unclassified Mesorhizobium TaxID=325217 RepID=UPI0003CEEB82|nr:MULTISPECIES: hypothetical protein [unclassified Mesorhizobium]ESX29955.1 hypothetical protein X765_13280 [Mesorhizobium sp. LSHC440B00]ESX35527.1 hypothetical protein X763_17590 [Mesorhizobium sp. LSHC432A00]ESX41941.1 hypothetical protein X764_13865 [Mesorhizobium sp. LSHC440A00]WJI55105.1 hypothetical protein NLY33_17860 [Mesorhizobium sp. C432A]